jgi:hypothetical protein
MRNVVSRHSLIAPRQGTDIVHIVLIGHLVRYTVDFALFYQCFAPNTFPGASLASILESNNHILDQSLH